METRNWTSVCSGRTDLSLSLTYAKTHITSLLSPELLQFVRRIIRDSLGKGTKCCIFIRTLPSSKVTVAFKLKVVDSKLPEVMKIISLS